MFKRFVRACILALLSSAVTAHEEKAVSALDQFQALYQKEWNFRLREFPLTATWAGENQFNHRLGSVDEESQRRRYEYWQAVIQQLDLIKHSELPLDEQINAAIFRRQIESSIANYQFKSYLIPINSDSGFHSELAQLPRLMPFNSLRDYQNYLSRLGEVARVFAENKSLMKQGLSIGMTLPQAVLHGREVAFATHVVDDAWDSVYYQPFQSRPNFIDVDQWQALSEQAVELIQQRIVPAYRDFSHFFKNVYIPGASDSIAAKALPNGPAFYESRVRYFTTLDLTSTQIHEVGLAEVARIRSEMQRIIQALNYDGDFQAFINYLRTDPRFYAKTADELLMRAAYYAKKMDGQLPSLFSRLPRQPYGIEPVPDDIAPYYTGGRYVPASINSTESGTYWVNTYHLKSRPLYVLPALTLHEAVPGHHLQNALAAELDEQPPFRRYDYISAYGEGWGLYSEYLGVEAGIYETPYENFGRLTYEMWRACRLVVDTGIHAFGWNRQQAIDYMAANTALSMHEVTTEIDRYISWPGQALAYKMGELTIKRLRRHAEEKLGKAFDLRAFHDLLLAQGSVPLPILEQQVERYIASELSD